MPKTLSDKKAAELLAEFLRARGDSLYLKNWEQELKAILQVFAVKYHELSPKTAEPASTKNCPSKLLHEFFVKSLRNIMDDLPSDVDKLREAVDALDGQHASRKRRRTENNEADGKQVSRKRGRTENDEADAKQAYAAYRKRRRTENDEAHIEVDIPKGKRAMIRHVSKLKVYIAGSYTIHAPKGQAEVIELTLGDPSIIDVKFWFPPGRVSAIPDSHDF